MSEEYLRDQINKIAVEIEKVEKTAKQKRAYITNRIEEEFGSKISEIEVELKNNKDVLAEVNNNIAKLTSKKKELVPIVKKLEKELSSLKKKKNKSLNKKVKAILKEKKGKTKIINRKIKKLKKELKTT